MVKKSANHNKSYKSASYLTTENTKIFTKGAKSHFLILPNPIDSPPCRRTGFAPLCESRNDEASLRLTSQRFFPLPSYLSQKSILRDNVNSSPKYKSIFANQIIQ